MATLAPVDGRRLRREQNREAVLDALLELFREGTFEPGAAAIAERAGLSPRSLFRYFDDIEDLHRAAAARELGRAARLVSLDDIGPDDSTASKIDRLVTARSRLFETIGPAARAIRACAHRHPPMAQELHRGRSFLRDQIRRLFRDELQGDRVKLLPAVDALCSFEAYELMRSHQGLSVAKTKAALTAALHALLVEAA